MSAPDERRARLSIIRSSTRPEQERGLRALEKLERLGNRSLPPHTSDAKTITLRRASPLSITAMASLIRSRG
jgi:hypothetical protein